MGNKLINVATTEAHPPLGNAFRKIGRTWHSLADLDQAQSISECVIVGDSLGYQGMNARSAKETLQMRTSVLEEYQAAVKTTISKRRNIERLKASSNIRPDRVDEALEDMEEVSHLPCIGLKPSYLECISRPISMSKHLLSEQTAYLKTFTGHSRRTIDMQMMTSHQLSLSMLAPRLCMNDSFFENWKLSEATSTMPRRRWHLLQTACRNRLSYHP